MIAGILSIAFLLVAVPLDVSVTQDGGLRIDECVISMGCKVGDKNIPVASKFEESANSYREFTIGRPKEKPAFSGKWQWTTGSDGSILGKIEMQCEADTDVQELCPRIALPHSEYPNAAWMAKGKRVALGESGFFKSMTVKDFTLELGNGNIFTLTFNGPTQVKVRDGSAKTGLWYVRFGMYQGAMSFVKGDKISFSVKVSSPSPSCISLHPYANFVIGRSDKWIPIRNEKDFVRGSALDFSGMKLQDAPAGKYGWLKSVGGTFEFEGLPGVPQRFCGANLCHGANFVSHALADSLVERFVALGYNSVRIHHHDRDIFQPGYWDNLDYLIAKFIEKGIYITTDLYVARNVKYSDIGLKGDSVIKKGLFKQLIACYEPAFKNWCDFSRTFLEHVNPYTGRAYKDEPGMPWISLVNEGKLTTCGDKNYPPLFEEWQLFGGEGRLKYNSPRFEEFEDYLNEKVFDKCSAFVRSLGVKALLSNDNNGKRHGDKEGCTQKYDYVDNHFYIDTPKSVGARNTLPIVLGNINLVTEKGPEMFRKYDVTGYSRPYTITEWNFCGPNRYRSIAGLMVGAMSSTQGWDGLWRFAYSHMAEDVAYNPHSYPSKQNLACDPLNMATERATVCLFLRGDMKEGRGLEMNPEDGSMTVSSPLTCGIFRNEGEGKAGVLNAVISGAPASIWVSSLDSKPVANSERMLLVHLTDVQGENVRYSDYSRSMLLNWGEGTVVEKGKAKVHLAVANPDAFKVYALSTSGERTGKVKTRVERGALSFEISTDGPAGGCIYYEIVKN